MRIRRFSAFHRNLRYLVIQNRQARGLGLLCGLLALGGCDAAQSEAYDSPTAAVSATVVATAQREASLILMTVGERRFVITPADTEAARAFAAMLPLSIDMADFNSNEKHAELLKSLPASANRPGTIRNGDLMLYGSKTLVLFYLTFNSSYTYTRLGRVDDPAGLAQALGSGNVRIEFTRK